MTFPNLRQRLRLRCCSITSAGIILATRLMLHRKGADGNTHIHTTHTIVGLLRSKSGPSRTNRDVH